jgi:hypothetical protein
MKFAASITMQIQSDLNEQNSLQEKKQRFLIDFLTHYYVINKAIEKKNVT